MCDVRGVDTIVKQYSRKAGGAEGRGVGVWGSGGWGGGYNGERFTGLVTSWNEMELSGERKRVETGRFWLVLRALV